MRVVIWIYTLKLKESHFRNLEAGMKLTYQRKLVVQAELTATETELNCLTTHKR